MGGVSLAKEKGKEKEKERERAAMKRNQGLEAMKKLGKEEIKNVQMVLGNACVMILIGKAKEKNLQKANHLKVRGLKGVIQAREKGKEREIMKNQKFAAVKMVQDQEDRCQNQGVIALMTRKLAQSALQDLPWKKSLC